MPTLLEQLAATVGFMHARRVYRRFLNDLDNVEAVQQRVLTRALAVVSDSDFGRRHSLRSVRSADDLKRAIPLLNYDDLRPYIDRVAAGDNAALLSPGQRILMFATSSGTTAEPKRIPVTPAFVDDYRRGWNTFGLKMLADHPRAILRSILQSTSRHDSTSTSAGIPCGSITGLLALMQKGIVRRFYVGTTEVAHLDSPVARYYTLMRLGIVRDIGFAVTASPATLIQMARTVDEHSETLIRDVRDGTLSDQIVGEPALRRALSAKLTPNRTRADELERLRAQHGGLRPRDYWRIEFLACWTGGTMGHYLERLGDWWGPLPVRDIGLLASEGRVSLPLDDGTPCGALDVTSAVFEFIPVEQADDADPPTLPIAQLEPGRDYAVVLTNTAALVRYRLNDVIRVRGWLRGAPLIEFLSRAGRVASVAGEKLTEHQVTAAVQAARQAFGLPEFDYLVAPCWHEPPFYRLTCSCSPPSAFAGAVDDALAAQNEEYASRRKSNRLGPLAVRPVPIDAIPAMDRRLAAIRRSTAEQYKRPCLFTLPGQDDDALA